MSLKLIEKLLPILISILQLIAKLIEKESGEKDPETLARIEEVATRHGLDDDIKTELLDAV